jgi:hypothetical protein
VPGPQKAAAERLDTLFQIEEQKYVGKMSAKRGRMNMSRLGIEPSTT